MNDELYEQFKNMKIPADIKPLEPFTRESLTKELKRKIDIKRTLVISLNTGTFRPNEVHIHTADIGSTYEPDFDFSDLNEFDAWRKTCRLKFNLQRFENVDAVRCEGFLHKMQICESLTLFEEVHRMLKKESWFLISVYDLFKLIKEISIFSPIDMNKLYHYEKLLFSAGDSTGVYYNRTFWTFERLEYYLKMAKFSSVEKVDNDNKYTLSVKATKINSSL